MPELNNLEVIVYSARNVAITNKINDCLCIVKCGKQSYGTGICANTNSPKWDTTTTFDKVKTGSHFTVTVQSSKKKFLGKVKVPFEKIQSSPQAIIWLPLKGKSGNDSSKVTGEIHLRWIYKPGGRASSSTVVDQTVVAAPAAAEKIDFTQVHKQNQAELFGTAKPKAEENSAGWFNKIWSSNEPAPVENDLSTTDGVIAQTEAVRSQSLASTQRTLKTLDSSIATGTTTLDKLQHQGQQLKNISYDLEGMEGKLEEGSRNLRGVQSIWGSAANKFTKNKKEDLANRPVRSKGASSSEIKDSRPDLTEMKIKNNMRKGTVDFTASQVEEVEQDETDKNIQEIGRRVSILKELALDYSTEIQEQSATIDKVDHQVEKNNTEIKRQSAWIRKLL